jgi:hypothetical protein
MTDILLPWWTPWLLAALVIGTLFASAQFDRYSRARLREAMAFWRRSRAVWDAIDAQAEKGLSAEGLRAMEAFLAEEVDQAGSIASDYHEPADEPPKQEAKTK